MPEIDFHNDPDSRAALRAWVDKVLSTLTAPLETRLLTGRVISAMRDAGVPLPEDIEALVGPELATLARTHPNATHDGSTFVRFGRTSQRWRWHSTAQQEPAPQPPKAKPLPSLATLMQELAELRERVTALELRDLI